ncbi:hypothetical protein EV360DRAFT_86942 [Lentinula raphanica]|nr:hypothetical protein EV360DRAFT_86942 [Lentinula raphanica]
MSTDCPYAVRNARLSYFVHDSRVLDASFDAFFTLKTRQILLMRSTKEEERRLDQASRLGSAKKRKLTKAEWARRLAGANAARKQKLLEGQNVESEDDSEESDKENDLERANTQISVLAKKQDASRKKTVYWKKQTEKLRIELRESKRHQMEKEEEEQRQKMEKEEEERLKEAKRLMLTEEQNRAMNSVLAEKDQRIQALEEELQKERKRRRDESDAYDETRGQLEVQVHEYQRQIHALKAKVSRIPARLVTTANRVARTFNTRADEERKFYLKNTKGVIPDDARDVFLDLVAMENVPANRVTHVFKRIAAVFGIEVEGDVSERSIGRILKEGGNASKLQFISVLNEAKGVTISGDGTTHKNETYESKFATVITPQKRVQFFLGIQMAVNHTSETQLSGWIESIEDFFHLAYESELASENDTRTFWNLVTGFHSDHAADQQKLFGLMKKWKQQLDREKRGERAVQGLSDNEYACLVFQGSQTLVQMAGGPMAWEQLSFEERTRQIVNMKKQLTRDIGEAEFQKLSEAEKSEVELFLWAGCCMHKEMNAFKGGCVGLDEFWDKHPEITSPLPLPNRDNAATIHLASGTAAAARAKMRTERGAVKLASLAGMIFRHKDRKRGQQDTLRFYFDYKIGFNLAFPDTSNTRFQSHAEACALIITHLDLFIEFLTYVKHNKGSGSLNHMEQNVLNGLQDIATRHELCAITLYWLAISIPYMREVRGPNAKEDNVLKLNGLHRRVIEHIDVLIDHPEYLVGSDASAVTGSLDGLTWERPDAFYAVQSYAPTLPHLTAVIVHFLRQARIVWLRFMSEFEEGGLLSSATSEQID